MRNRGFSGGIHPATNKDRSRDSIVRRPSMPPRLHVPLSQHVGAPASPVVSSGDTVLRGQVIGEAQGSISASVHSPVDGQVARVYSTLLLSGVQGDVIEIVPHAQQDWGSFVKIDDSGDVSETLRMAGIVGLGGAAFPSSVKLHSSHGKPIHTVIVNGCECEPYLTSDDRLMRESPARVVAGARILGRAMGAKRIVIALEDDKPEAQEALSGHSEPDVEILVLPARFPQGAEKQLIYSVIREEVPHGRLPASVGVLVHNVGTAAAIADAVQLRKPLIERVVTVTGHVGQPANFLALIGTPISHLLSEAGGFAEEVSRIIVGGPMTGVAVADLDLPVVKGTSGLIALTDADLPPAVHSDQPCIRCSRCVDACPMRLQPYAIGIYANRADWDGIQRFVPLSCIECGCCETVCPTRRPLIQLIRRGKQVLISRGVEA